MESAVIETATSSTKGQGSTMLGPRLYAGVAALLVIVVAAVVFAPKLLQSQLSVRRPQRQLFL